MSYFDGTLMRPQRPNFLRLDVFRFVRFCHVLGYAMIFVVWGLGILFLYATWSAALLPKMQQGASGSVKWALVGIAFTIIGTFPSLSLRD